VTQRHPWSDQPLDAVASLGDHRRRKLYRYVVDSKLPATRDEAAAGTGLSRSVAAYHLDKLAAAGLLDVLFERRTGRQGPGAGRPAKLYRRPTDAVEVSLPRRDYVLMAGLLAQAVDADQSGVANAALQVGARTVGAELGGADAAARPSVLDVLARIGYEPVSDGDAVRSRNCPFGELARRHRDLICGANLALIEGIVDAVGSEGEHAVLDPGPDRCCVAVLRSA
jgi:predicted ArsR family transcriptional regulator